MDGIDMPNYNYKTSASTGVTMTYTCKCGVIIQCAGEKLLETVVANHFEGNIHIDGLEDE